MEKPIISQKVRMAGVYAKYANEQLGENVNDAS